MTVTDEHKVHDVRVDQLLSEDEVLAEFAAVMVEWGHYKTAEKLRFPTQEEVLAKLEQRFGERTG